MRWAGTLRTLRHFWGQAPTMVTGCVLGTVAGLAAVAFHLVIDFIFHHTVLEFSTWSLGEFAAASFGVIVFSSVVSGWLLSSFAPDAAGSGIPQVKAAFWKDFGSIPIKTVLVKFVAGALSVGSGVSLGREGPTVQIASGLASHVSGFLGVAKQKRRMAAAAGAAAGLSAAFKTPLAAITFVLEEVISDMNSRFLSSVLLASVMGAVVTYGLLGSEPVFHIQAVEEIGWGCYLAVPLVAGFAATVGVEFQRFSLWLRAKMKRVKVPGWVKPMAGGVATWLMAMTIFVFFQKIGVFGMGYVDLTEALNGGMVWTLALAFLVAKFIATSFAYGTGGCGGIFAPTLFLGGMAGAGMSGLLGGVIPFDSEEKTVLAVVGMCACFGAVVRAPITAILIIFEMTHEFLLIPPLMLATIFSQLISRYRLKDNFYEEALIQDGHDVKQMIPPRDLQQWRQRPVASACTFSPTVVTSMESEVIREVVEDSPHNRFPVVIEGKVRGLIRRYEALNAISEGREPTVVPASWVKPNETIGAFQRSLIDAPIDLALVGHEESNQLLGVITLHDLLRHQEEILEKV